MSLDSMEGYERLYAEEGCGSESGTFGIKVFVKMSQRKIDDEDAYGDAGNAICTLIKAIKTRTAQLDPEGAERREAYRKEIAGAYVMAGVSAIYMESLPNGYCMHAYPVDTQ